MKIHFRSYINVIMVKFLHVGKFVNQFTITENEKITPYENYTFTESISSDNHTQIFY